MMLIEFKTLPGTFLMFLAVTQSSWIIMMGLMSIDALDIIKLSMEIHPGVTNSGELRSVTTVWEMAADLHHGTQLIQLICIALIMRT